MAVLTDSGFRKFEVEPYALELAKEMGFVGDIGRRLQSMARYSVPYRHSNDFNRRYAGYLLYVRDQIVMDIIFADLEHSTVDPTQINCLSCEGRMTATVHNICEDCEGVGCGSCDDGTIQATIPCQDSFHEQHQGGWD